MLFLDGSLRPWKRCIQEMICLKFNLKIRGVDFVANLIILELKGIDAILEMD
jgi:hypothetical protein